MDFKRKDLTFKFLIFYIPLPLVAGLTSDTKFDDDLVSTRGPDVGNDGTLASKLVEGMAAKSDGASVPAAPSAIDTSFVVWAETTDVIEQGVVLMNHWAQRAVVITSYDPSTGAKGYELNGLTIAAPGEVTPAARSEFTYTWPPLALEMELVDKKWQPTKVSSNIKNQEIFQYFPEEIRKTQTVAWELVFLLLLSNEEANDAEVIQALLDTGISPRKGLIAYMRLFKRVTDRTSVLNEVPAYRRIESVDRKFEN